MYKLLSVIAIASIAFLTGCSKKKQFIYENDTDSHEWINQQYVKTVPNPHSGTTVSVIDSMHAYSLGLSKTIANISDQKLTQVKFIYWAFIKSDQAKASTVLSIDLNGKNNLWEGRSLKGATLNTWTQIEETFAIPDKLDPSNVISLYIWNNSKEEILIDDLKIVFK